MGTSIKQIFIIGILSFFTTALFPQIYIEDEAIFQEAEEYLEGEEYEEALPLYLLLEKKGYDNPNINYKIGSCYLNVFGQKQKAIPYLEKAVLKTSKEYLNSLTSDFAPMQSYLLLGKAYHFQGNFQKAIESFKSLHSRTNDPHIKQLAAYYESKAYNAIAMTGNQTRTKLSVLKIPSSFAVYNVICSKKSELLLMEKRKFYDAIVNVELKDDVFVNYQNLTRNIRSDGDYILCGGSSDGVTLFFTGYDPKNGDEIFFTKKGANGEYSKLRKLPQPINSKFNEVSAFLVNDSTIYFSSNRIGGYGGFDIYRSKLLQNDEWSTPKNMGESINTVFNESAPFSFIDEGLNWLIFSSQGHLNMGGYDFFYSLLDSSGSPSQAVNMGSPVSTADDDLYLTSHNNAPMSFYTSRIVKNEEFPNRVVKIQLLEKLGKPKALVEGQLEYNDTMPSKPVPFIVIDKVTSSIVIDSSTSDQGNYSFMVEEGEYEIEFKYNESTTAKEEFIIAPNSALSEYYLPGSQWATESNKEESVPGEVSLFALYIKDILFGFNEFNLPEAYSPMLDSIAFILLNDNSAKLRINAYTDNIGSEKYNLWLSEKRAGAIFNYIVSKGVASGQLAAKTFGESNPVAKNTQKDGTDYPQGRKFNRRAALQLESKSEGLKIIYLNIVPDHLKLK